jgi:hypothetical protein
MRIFILVTLFVLAESPFLVRNLFRYFKSPEHKALDLGIENEDYEIVFYQRESDLSERNVVGIYKL